MSNQYKRKIKPKKSLGQHFLKDEGIAMDIADLLSQSSLPVLEIGPGTGALTKFLFKKYGTQLHLVELDKRSIPVLKNEYPTIQHQLYEEDFLQMDLQSKFPNGVNIIGNFPYNISSQIVIKILENAHLVNQFGGMFQKEVAERLTASPSSKQYGQLTLMRAMDYNANYLFDVPNYAFDPPPKVTSGVILLTRNQIDLQGVSKQNLKLLIKQGFSQRRKKLRNTLKQYFSADVLKHEIFDKRPEALTLQEFIQLSYKANF